jgi:hypothetical protein
MYVTPEISPEQEQRSRVIWNELVEQCRAGPLPFVRPDSENPENIAVLWDVTDTGDELEDATRGLFYADLLIYRAKHWRGAGDPFQAIAEICMEIVKKGNPGRVEWGFFSRLAMLAMAASLN